MNPKNQYSFKYFNLLQAIFITLIISGNVLALKMTSILSIVTPAGMICFPFTYTINDIITEIYKKEQTIGVIKNGLICLAIFSVFVWLSVRMAPAPGWHNQAAYETLFSFTPRLLIATIIGYLSGEILNSVILSKLYQRFNGRFYLPRSIFSTAIGVLVDSIAFNISAFSFTMPLATLIIFITNQFILKFLFEVCGSFISTPIVAILKAKEKNIQHDNKFNIENILREDS